MGFDFGKIQKADYRMRIINADGSEQKCAAMARCMAAYIVKNKSPKKIIFFGNNRWYHPRGSQRGSGQCRLSDLRIIILTFL